MSIIRVNKSRDYSIVCNEPFRDARLSWDARGILGYLLTKPDDWTVRTEDLIKQGTAKRFVVLRCLRELEICGYYWRDVLNEEGTGIIEHVSEIYESPSINPHFKPESNYQPAVKPESNYPTSVKPTSGNQTHKKDLDKEKLNIRKTEKKEPTARKRAGGVKTELPEWMPVAVWERWLLYRQEIKHPVAVSAIPAMLSRLDRFRQDGHSPVEVIEQTMANSWRGLFELPERNGNGNGKHQSDVKKLSNYDRIKRNLARCGVDIETQHSGADSSGLP